VSANSESGSFYYHYLPQSYKYFLFYRAGSCFSQFETANVQKELTTFISTSRRQSAVLRKSSMGTTTTNQNYIIHEEVKRKLNWGKASYQSAHSILSSRLLCTNVMGINIYTELQLYLFFVWR